MALEMGDTKNKYFKIKRTKQIYNNKKEKKRKQLCKRGPAETYLGLFQTPEGFEQVAQVATNTIKILRRTKEKISFIRVLHKNTTDKAIVD